MQAEAELVKIDINCNIKGDIVLECTSLHKDLEHEDMMFRIVFNLAFIRSNIIMLNREEIDTQWDTKYHFPKDFRIEVCLAVCLAVCLISFNVFSTRLMFLLTVLSLFQSGSVFGHGGCYIYCYFQIVVL